VVLFTGFGGVFNKLGVLGDTTETTLATFHLRHGGETAALIGELRAAIVRKERRVDQRIDLPFHAKVVEGLDDSLAVAGILRARLKVSHDAQRTQQSVVAATDRGTHVTTAVDVDGDLLAELNPKERFLLRLADGQRIAITKFKEGIRCDGDRLLVECYTVMKEFENVISDLDSNAIDVGEKVLNCGTDMNIHVLVVHDITVVEKDTVDDNKRR